MMRMIGAVALVAVCSIASFARQGGAQANPVSETLRQLLVRSAKNMVAAAEAMPAGKFDYHPTPEQMTFAHLIGHIATSNNFLCSKISGMTAPQQPPLADTDPKDKLVAALKGSFDYCTTALANVSDSGLGDSITLYGNRPSTKAAAMFSLANDWADHYSAQASYLRLNGILPPTAQPAPGR